MKIYLLFVLKFLKFKSMPLLWKFGKMIRPHIWAIDLSLTTIKSSLYRKFKCACGRTCRAGRRSDPIPSPVRLRAESPRTGWVTKENKGRGLKVRTNHTCLWPGNRRGPTARRRVGVRGTQPAHGPSAHWRTGLVSARTFGPNKVRPSAIQWNPCGIGIHDFFRPNGLSNCGSEPVRPGLPPRVGCFYGPSQTAAATASAPCECRGFSG